MSSMLSELPRKPLTPQQQMEAVRKVQAQAEQRVKLGMQLFQAAESRLTAQANMLQQVRSEQKVLREQMRDDVAKSLQAYDQWIGQIDENFTGAMKKLEAKVDKMAAEWARTQQKLAKMVERSEVLLDQSRSMLEQNREAAAPQPAPEPQAPQPLKFEQPSAVKQPASYEDDEQVYSLILEKLRHEDTERSA